MTNNSKIRVRFAPSPSGELHVGGARTALFNWLFARHHNGTFVLRFEDTDEQRNDPSLFEPIMESFRWLGLEWDEGPYYQSERLAIHQEYVQTLLENGKAYNCFCTSEELDAKRQAAQKAKENYRYDGKCRNLSTAEKETNKAENLKSVVRLKVESTGQTQIHDIIKGDLSFENSEIDDFIIQRSNGRPIYNFVVAIDDALMEISHVIRAEEHLKNTLRQYFVYKALDLNIPQFAHVPMVLAKDRAKLSKRHGATAVFEYRDRGILPEALVNYLVRLGWSHGDQEIFTQDELIEKFALDDVNDSAAIYDEEKLQWVNHQYVMHGNINELGSLTKQFAVSREIYSEEEANSVSEESWARVVDFLKERSESIIELAESSVPFLKPELETYDAAAVQKFLTPDKAPLLLLLSDAARELPQNEFSTANIDAAMRAKLQENGNELKEVAQPCRIALTGVTKGPGLFEAMEFLGKERVIDRLNKAIDMIGER